MPNFAVGITGCVLSTVCCCPLICYYYAAFCCVPSRQCYLPPVGSYNCIIWMGNNKVFKHEVWCISYCSNLSSVGSWRCLLHFLPKLWPSARTNTHEQLLLPPVDEACMPWLLTQGELNWPKVIVGDSCEHFSLEILTCNEITQEPVYQFQRKMS